MLIFKLAFRNILRQKRRSILTGLSMMGGYILTVFSFSLVEGSYNNIIDIFTLDHTGHIQIHNDDYLHRPKIYKSIQDTAKVERLLSTQNHVVAFSARVFAPALAYSQDKSSPTKVIGIDPDHERQTSRLGERVASGEYLDSVPTSDGYFKAMIGKSLADYLNLKPGDELVVISQAADGSIANDIFIVQAIVGSKNSFDKRSVYLPLTAAQEFLSMGSAVHEYAIVLADRHLSRVVADEIQTKLPDLSVAPWQVVEETFYQSMQSDKQGNHFTTGIIIFIVFIGVLNTVLMSVLERTREFGVLKAIGSRPLAIMKMIFLETIMLATISIVIGFVISIPLIAWFTEVGILMPEATEIGGIEFQHLKGEFTTYVFLVPAIIILGFAAMVSLPPGFRAARVLPRDALGSH